MTPGSNICTVILFVRYFFVKNIRIYNNPVSKIGDRMQANKKPLIKLIFAKTVFGPFMSYPNDRKNTETKEQAVIKKNRMMMDFHIGFSENLKARFVIYLSIIIPNCC